MRLAGNDKLTACPRRVTHRAMDGVAPVALEIVSLLIFTAHSLTLASWI